MARHLDYGHPEWEYMNTKEGWVIAQVRICYCVDLLHACVGHRVATDGHAVSTDHQSATRPPVVPITLVALSREKWSVPFYRRSCGECGLS